MSEYKYCLEYNGKKLYVNDDELARKWFGLQIESIHPITKKSFGVTRLGFVDRLSRVEKVMDNNFGGSKVFVKDRKPFDVSKDMENAVFEAIRTHDPEQPMSLATIGKNVKRDLSYVSRAILLLLYKGRIEKTGKRFLAIASPEQRKEILRVLSEAEKKEQETKRDQ